MAGRVGGWVAGFGRGLAGDEADYRGGGQGGRPGIWREPGTIAAQSSGADRRRLLKRHAAEVAGFAGAGAWRHGAERGAYPGDGHGEISAAVGEGMGSAEA